MSQQIRKGHGRFNHALPEVLPTAVVGSYSVPDWLWRFKTEAHRGRLSAAALEEIVGVAIKAAVVDQTLCGVDIISDGELGRDNDMDYLLSRISGIEIATVRKRDSFDYLEAAVQTPLPEVPGVDTTGLVSELCFVRSLTKKTITTSLAGPFSLSRQLRRAPNLDERQLVLSLARAVNTACKALVAQGATHLQLDEPRLAGYPECAGLAIEAVNLATEGVEAHVALHVCYGNRFARPAWEGHYDFLFPAIEAANVDEVVLEFARKGFDDLQLFTRSSTKIEVGVGVIDVKRLDVEPVAVVESRLYEALKVLPPERVVVNPDCGLRHLPAKVVRAKLSAMTKATANVREDVLGTRARRRFGARGATASTSRGGERRKALDVLAVGNAIVDLLSEVDEGVVGSLGLKLGTMTLVDDLTEAALSESIGWEAGVSGGSAANTAVGVVSLGGSAGFVGRLGHDRLGEVFAEDLRSTGVVFDNPSDKPGAVGGDEVGTGRCLVLVTPDGERTMVTYLGASVALRDTDLDFDLFTQARVVYLEGYLADAPNGYRLLRRAAELARAGGAELALSLSDPFLVERHRELLAELASEASVLFANEVEARLFVGSDDFEHVLDALGQSGRVRVVTRGAAGSIVLANGARFEVPAAAVGEVVDTTGAGDLFAAGFLYGWVRGRHVRTCAELGSLAAGAIVVQMGARPRRPLAEIVADHVSTGANR
jgi:5-methyltetrahydropteroyltriglutamate--homocysteine methyltransferase